jgi:1,4-dihydroxy-2-naphthoate octaprenyltransferase
MKKLSTIIMSARPWSFLLSISGVSVGTVIAATYGSFNLWLFIVVLAAVTILHAAMNLINDYYDYRHGVDRPNVATAAYRPHPLVEGTMKPRQILVAALVLYALAIGIAVYLSLVRGWVVVALSAIGWFISYFYTADPINFKGKALGEIVMFIGSGPVMVVGAFFVQTASLANVWPVVLVSVSIGLWWSLVLVANNMKDIETDQQSPGRTVAILLGRPRTIVLYIGMVGTIYVLTAIEIAIGIIPVWGIVIFVSLVPLVRLINSFRAAPEIPADADPRTAKVEVLFTILFLAAFVMQLIVPINIA